MIRRRSLVVLATALMLTGLGAGASTSSAENFINDSLIVTGDSCIGSGCTSGMTPERSFVLRTGDTPVVRFDQTNDDGYTPYIWDIAGNESNFFLRDTTNSSRLVFRAFPGAVSNQLELRPNGLVSTAGQFAISTNSAQTVNPLGLESVLTNLRGVGFETYTIDGQPELHTRAVPGDFATAFGGSASHLSIGDVASIALGGVKALDARVTALPGPADNTARDARITALEQSNKSLAKKNKSLEKSLSALKKQVRKLARRR